MVLTSPHVRVIERATLPNGLRIVTEAMPYVRSVSLGVWIGSGSRIERPVENGISHFIEHMVFKGTTNRSAEDIARSVDSVGGGLDAFTSKELVSFNTKVMDEHLPLALDILADLVLNPLFREEDIEKEKSVILEEIKMEADQPEFVLHETFISNFWKGHGLGQPILGTKETVKKFSRQMLFDYYNRVYSPRNILITAAGNLEHHEIVRLVCKHFSAMPDREPVPVDTVPKPHAPIVLKKKESLEQVHIAMGVPSYPLAHEMRFPLYVLNTVLGGGMSSRLFQNIREKQGLAYAVYSELNLFSDTGCFTVYAGTAVETAEQVVQSVVQELKALKQELIGEDELRRAKDHLKGSLMLSLESTSSRMSNLARQELYFNRFMSLDEMLESIEAVTREEVQQIAREFCTAENVALAMLGRLSGVEMTREKLAC
ncbi:MAG: insulinase family protein [Acidobacteriaceae bacterium]|nr:insulinase family protein [Acidobacteriaceae bacterium]MBV8569061.1 insulinase family protein [Acidobacteriaceae bacterium]